MLLPLHFEPSKSPVLELKIWCVTPELKESYKQHIEKHNSMIENIYSDAGFDLLNSVDVDFEYIKPDKIRDNISGTEYSRPLTSYKYPLGIKLSLSRQTFYPGTDKNVMTYSPMPYMLLPRSSTGAKTNFRLSNSVGVIDSGYRGIITALVDLIDDRNENEMHKLECNNRNFQIVAFNGYSMHVTLVDDENALGSTDRGTGGFGSTGN